MLQDVSSVNYLIIINIFIAICADAKQEAIEILWFSRPRRQTKTAVLRGICSVLCFSWLGRQSWGSSEKLKKKGDVCAVGNPKALQDPGQAVRALTWPLRSALAACLNLMCAATAMC